jgi:hypothetical protein
MGWGFGRHEEGGRVSGDATPQSASRLAAALRSRSRAVTQANAVPCLAQLHSVPHRMWVMGNQVDQVMYVYVRSKNKTGPTYKRVDTSLNHKREANRNP